MKSFKNYEVSLWFLAFLCAAVPFIATHLAWVISIYHHYIPTCIPYLEGCTSISRSARHGLANQVFKAIMLPAAFIQVLTWFALWQWIKKMNPKAIDVLPLAGIIAGIFLTLYVVFLGTDGAIYQHLRRWGISVYFGATYLGQLIAHHQMKNHVKGPYPKAMLGICLMLFPLALLGLYYSITTMDVALNDQIENIIEWNLSALMMIWFFLLSLFWKKENIKVSIA